jgi:glycosyltransferase involved in cell wall biosynthesis
LRSAILPKWLKALRQDVGGPVIVTMHEVTRDTARLRAPGRALYRSLARHCDRIIVHTQAAAAVLTGSLGIPADKVVIIPHPAARPPAGEDTAGALRDRFGLGDALVLLAFGFVHVDKGLQDLVRALGVLRRSGELDHVRVCAVIAGAVRRRHGFMRVFGARDHIHLRRVLWLARRHRVSDRLRVTGYVADGDVAAWFQTADAVVLPYRRAEQSGVANMAVALGRPVLASRAGGLDQLFGASAWSFPPRDHHELARTLAAFLATPQDRRESVAASNGGVSLAEVASATIQLYAGALSIERTSSDVR